MLWTLPQPCTRTLRELNVSNNKFGDNGLFMLKLGLLANRSVDRLFLSGSRITCEGMCKRRLLRGNTLLNVRSHSTGRGIG